jgi:GNAT superfamily N-acetyltransferase
MRISELTAEEMSLHLDDLVVVLADAIDSGASVSFLETTPRTELAAFWISVANNVRARSARLLAAFSEERVVGTAQLWLAMPPNQPHRAEVTKLLVHRSERRRGIGAKLMAAAEELGREENRTLLTLDTLAGSDAERLYSTLGWVRVGTIRDYALRPDGKLGDTAIFYKRL